MTGRIELRSKEKKQSKGGLPVIVNAPLDFRLNELDPMHPYLLNCGFTPETIEHFGLGFCSRGFLKDRIAIPLHDAAGSLIGFAGRVVDDNLITEENPRYKFPGPRTHNGKLLEFERSLFLYYGFCIRAPVDNLIVVEEFSSVWWLFQKKQPNVVALMGSSCSQCQARLIISLVRSNGCVWIMPGGNEMDEGFAESLLRQISPHRFVRWIKLVYGEQPTNLTDDRLMGLFS